MAHNKLVCVVYKNELNVSKVKKKKIKANCVSRGMFGVHGSVLASVKV